MPKLPIEKCCGCTACYSACMKAAIKMLPNYEGFLYPSVDEQQCINCGLCEQVCPLIHEPVLPQNYADSMVIQVTDEETLEACTSGGFMDALFRHVLVNMNGWGAGVAFDEGFMPVHLITNSYDQAKTFRNSKYAQSDLGLTFKRLRELLNKGETALFVGTPCQVAGLKGFLRKNYDNLITADLVCRSIPSPGLWRTYLQWQANKHRSRIKQVFCRKKTYGYHSGTLEIHFANGKCYRGSNRVDYFMKSFHHDICSRDSCYQCAFKTKHRCSDFTVFDSWNPQAVVRELSCDNNKGYSNVIVHTPRGKAILEQMDGLTVYHGDPEDMFRFTGGMESTSVLRKPARDSFYKDLEQLGFEKTVRKHISVTQKDRLIEALKPAWYMVKNTVAQRKGKS